MDAITSLPSERITLGGVRLSPAGIDEAFRCDAIDRARMSQRYPEDVVELSIRAAADILKPENRVYQCETELRIPDSHRFSVRA